MLTCYHRKVCLFVCLFFLFVCLFVWWHFIFEIFIAMESWWPAAPNTPPTSSSIHPCTPCNPLHTLPPTHHPSHLICHPSTSLHYISLYLVWEIIDDQHRNTNMNDQWADQQTFLPPPVPDNKLFSCSCFCKSLIWFIYKRIFPFVHTKEIRKHQ